MAYPYERYIVYRILRGDTQDEVNGRLKQLFLPLAKDYDWSHLKDKVKLLCVPRGYKQIYHKNSKVSVPQGAMDFLRFHGFDKLFAFDDDLKGYLKDEMNCAMEGAFTIHEQPFARLAINVLLFHGNSYDEIVDLVKEGHKFTTSSKSLKLYEELFFNHRKMSPDDWNNYLNKLQGKEKEILYVALTNRLEDIKYLIRVPTRVEYTDFLKNALETANYKFNYYSALNTENGDKNAMAWAKTALTTGEKYQKYKEDEETDIFKKFQMEFEHEEDDIPLADEQIAHDVNMDNQKTEQHQEGAGEDLDIVDASTDPEDV